jgi:glucose-6-phosphate isomerase
MYVDTLIGAETVNTVPPATYTAIRDHGTAALTLEQGLDESRQIFARLAEIGVDLKAVTEKLQRDGLDAFVKSFDTLAASIEAKRDALISGINERVSLSLGKYGDAVQPALKEAEKDDAVRRIWRKDAALWKSDEQHQKIIRNALGWLTVVDCMIGAEDELLRFAAEVRDAGFTHTMVCGMGGSSLCPEVLRQTFGKQEGSPELLVLDSTDPDTIADFAARIDAARTLFIISSKSGTTTEPLTFYKFWFDQVKQKSGEPGKNFVAITDPGTLMEQMATEAKFRKIFLNPADIGGRYSALSYFGLVPAALQGLDVRKLLDRAERVVHSCSQVVAVSENPGARLGAVIGECAKAGRDKLTIVADARIASLGLWVEQLIAESTGKDGKGVVPVANEPLGSPSVYGEDRLFVSVAVGKLDSETDAKLRALEAAGHPVVRLALTDTYDLGEQFFLWEIAAAFAGWRLGIDPFDQPNVQESKDATKELLASFARDGKLQEQTQLATDNVLTVYADDSSLAAGSVAEVVKAHLARVKAGDYVALLDYFEESDEHDRLVQQIRTHLRDATRCATTTGYGPRFLHSTGQLHKGGSDAGVFLQLTAQDKTDLQVPGEPYTFSVLKQAQALGDFRSLARRNRRAIRVELGADVSAGLQRLYELIREALPLGETTRA